MFLQQILEQFGSLGQAKALLGQIANGQKHLNLNGLIGSARAAALAVICQKTLKPMLVIAPDSEEAEKFVDDLRAFLGDGVVHLFPAWGISPYEIRAPHADIIGRRLSSLFELSLCRDQNNSGRLVIVAPVTAVFERTIPKETLIKHSLHLVKGSKFDRDRLIDLLARLNYRRSPITEMLGEYSVRGGIVDIFTPIDEDPVRIEFFDDEIESIRHFSVLTQRSSGEIDSTYILPRREIIFRQGAIDSYAERLDESRAQALRVLIGQNGDYDGLEFFWPEIGAETSDIFQHFPDNAIVCLSDPDACGLQIDTLLDQARDRYAETGDFPVAVPELVYLTDKKFTEDLERFQSITLGALPLADSTNIAFQTLPQEFFGTNIAYMKSRLKELSDEGYELNILCEGTFQKDRIAELTDDLGEAIRLHVAQLSEGFAIPELRQWYLVDHQIFTRYKKRRTFKRHHEGVALSSYTNLNPGDYVVHIDYGIGRFKGLETLTVDGRQRDCLALLYLGDDRLFVPIEEFNRVQKYAGKDGAPRLSKLGSSTWERVKARTKKALLAMAGELVALYAERQAFPGFSFNGDNDWMRELEASFEFQETPDQLKAMTEIKADMERPTPMDRLICGDVGYGKTELAIRAALKAVVSGKQVAVLAPTTILAAQHLTTFSERLKQFPVAIKMLSRFCLPGQAKNIKEGLSDGTVDIVIGTHKLLQRDVRFKDLGLLIIDEEQRFGVAQKEKIKKLRSHVDVLTLTATPIPRTLQLSLAGARDMTVINTPPKDRLPITTEVSRFSDKAIVEAINRELERGGQVFLVHNRVQSIWAFYEYVRDLLPLVRIGVAHGQMAERELERVMKDFLDKKYQVLLSTTIIESGLDIPSVNTIVINRADKLGLAQLYQLRGRVGRSRYRAFAYLLVPPLKLLTIEARKRLKAIEEFTELGSGFHLAMRDLEIRGAGNLLGAQQHGFIEEVGFDLYIKLLEEAVAQLKGTRPEDYAADVRVTTDLDLFLPENYVPDKAQRVDIYRRFSGAADLESINDLKEELADRFGPAPEAVDNLADLAAIKIYARQIGLIGLQLKGGKVSLEFDRSRNIGRDRIERWVANIPQEIEFKYGRNFYFDIMLKAEGEGAMQVRNILQKMADCV